MLQATLTNLLPSLLAQESAAADEGSSSTVLRFVIMLAILFAVLVLPFIVGKHLARRLKMPDYGWRVGLILSTLACAGAIIAGSYDRETGEFDIRLGVDLKGGVILVYQVAVPAEDDSERDSRPDMDQLVQALANRINPSGTQEIVVRQFGDQQVEVIVPDVNASQVERIKQLISTAGSLEFRIVANRRDHQYLIDLAEAQAEDALTRRSKIVRNDQGEAVGFWARADREDQEDGQGEFRMPDLYTHILRNARTGELLTVPPLGPDDSLSEYLSEQGVTDVDVLVATDDGLNVTGDHLGVVRADFQDLQPAVSFRMNPEGAGLFGLLTSRNLPDRGTSPPFYRKLGIVLDETLISAPRLLSTIRENGQITGNFEQQEVDFLVNILRTGKLPATLQKTPISENQIGSMLGEDTIERGKIAIGASLLGVLIFVVIYYRFAGMVACLALITNLVMIFALMILLKAPLTLPGLAGLVLTVGMSVDANVLIFERIREELNKGAALRMAIRNGFGRATTTIVDANVTTLITALVLYAIGTDQVRGFAVTLILGILMSMFTAIFCSRVIFDIAERRRWITHLTMLRIVGATHLNFLGKRRIAAVASIVLIVAGIIGVMRRQEDILDIDFLGGTSVTAVLEAPMDPEDVRERLQAELGDEVQFSVNSVSVQGRDDNTVFKIDSSLQDETELQNHIADAFERPGTGSLLEHYSMTIQSIEDSTPPPTTVDPGGDDPGGEDPGGEDPGEEGAAGEDDGGATSDDTTSDDTTSDDTTSDDATSDDTSSDGEAGDGDTSEGDDDGTDAGTGAVLLPGGRLLQPVVFVSWQETGDEDAGDEDEGGSLPGGGEQPPGDAGDAEEGGEETTADPDSPGADEDVAPAGRSAQRSVAILSFGDRIAAPTLEEMLKEASRERGTPVDVVLLDILENDPDWTMDSVKGFTEWRVEMPLSVAEARPVLEYVSESLSQQPVWESSSQIGGKVAGDTQTRAIAALLASLLGILTYIWIRFQRVIFGLAAVVALIHDVLITLGAIALSASVAGFLGFLQIEEFKISLPVVAAFLTIIGYSLNDTIVVFDRIREVKGKNPDLTSDMINTSINQTLGRTLLTSLTTLLVVLVLYWFGGAGIHGFAFALVIGVIVGTYSSIFVASPVLLWLASTQSRSAEARKATSKSAAL